MFYPWSLPWTTSHEPWAIYMSTVSLWDLGIVGSIGKPINTILKMRCTVLYCCYTIYSKLSAVWNNTLFFLISHDTDQGSVLGSSVCSLRRALTKCIAKTMFLSGIQDVLPSSHRFWCTPESLQKLQGWISISQRLHALMRSAWPATAQKTSSTASRRASCPLLVSCISHNEWLTTVAILSHLDSVSPSQGHGHFTIFAIFC